MYKNIKVHLIRSYCNLQILANLLKMKNPNICNVHLIFSLCVNVVFFLGGGGLHLHIDFHLISFISFFVVPDGYICAPVVQDTSCKIIIGPIMYIPFNIDIDILSFMFVSARIYTFSPFLCTGILLVRISFCV